MPVDKSYIGRKGEPVTMHVERGKIREFARAIKDDDPLYFDEAHAAREAGGIMPPVTFLQTASHWDNGRGRPRVPFDLKRVLHGEQEYEFLAPIHAGDVLTAVSTVVDVYEKPGQARGQHDLRRHGDRIPQPAGDAGGPRAPHHDRDRPGRQGLRGEPWLPPSATGRT